MNAQIVHPWTLSAARLVHGLQGKGRMRIGAARAHLRGNPDRFHQFLRCRPLAKRGFGMPPDAVDTVIGVKRQSGLGDNFWLFRSLT